MHINVWTFIYLVGSLPVIAYYSAGLAGWFFDYPLGLFGSIFVVLAIPPALLVLKIASAPTWNVIGLWVGAGLIVVRVLHGLVYADPERLTSPALTILIGTIVGAIAWSSIWTAYFLKSERIAQTFAN